MSYKCISAAAEKDSESLTWGSTGFRPASLPFSPLSLTLTSELARAGSLLYFTGEDTEAWGAEAGRQAGPHTPAANSQPRRSARATGPQPPPPKRGWSSFKSRINQSSPYLL